MVLCITKKATILESAAMAFYAPGHTDSNADSKKNRQIVKNDRTGTVKQMKTGCKELFRAP